MSAHPLVCWLLVLSTAALPVATEPAAAEPAAGVTQLALSDALVLALQSNPRARLAESSVTMAEIRTDLARSTTRPEISLSGQFVRNDAEVSFGSDEDRVTILPENDWTYQVNLRQPIYAGLRELRVYQQAQLDINRAEFGLSAVQQQLLHRVASDYFDLLAAQELIEVETGNVELAVHRLDQTRDFYDVGEITYADLLRAQAGAKAAERRLVVARGQRRLAEGNLRRNLAFEEGRLDGEIEAVAPSQTLQPLDSEAKLIDFAEQFSPRLRQLQLGVDIAELEIRKQKGRSLPVVFLEGGWVRQKSGFPTDEFGFVSLNVEVPIFQGGSVRYRVLEAEQARQSAALRVEDETRQLREDVRAALVEVETAQAVLALALEEREASQRQYDETFELFRNQESTALDLESAENSLADAARRLVVAELNLETRRLDVWYLTGGLRHAMEAAGLLPRTAPTSDLPSSSDTTPTPTDDPRDLQ